MTSKILLSGGCVLTWVRRPPTSRTADVLIDEGTVAEIGSGLRARDAESVDATDTIVMPGFVDTHRHAWTSLFRNLGERAMERRGPGAGRRGRRSLPARRRLRRHPDRPAGSGRGGDHHRRRLVARTDPTTASARAALQAHADAGAAHRVRPRVAVPTSRPAGPRASPSSPDRRPSIAFGSVLPGRRISAAVADEWATAPASRACASTPTPARRARGMA